MFALVRTIGGFLIGGIVARLFGILSRLQFAATPQAKRTTRRNFTRNAALGAVVVVLAEIGAGLYYFVYPNKTGAFGKPLPVSKSNVPPVEGTPYTEVEGKFYIIHNHDGVMALYWKCVHLGCTVPWKPAEHRFHCPCHGSIYDYDGQRVAGPAPRSLDYMGVTVQKNGDLVVDTGKITQRALYEPKQATPWNF